MKASKQPPQVQKRREDQDELAKCIREYLAGSSGRNVMSALRYSFIKCYEVFEQLVNTGRVKGKYNTLFSRVASEMLHEEFKYSNIGDLLGEAQRYISSLVEFMGESFDVVYLVEFETVSRLSICTRDSNLPLEISISWDPVLNLPFIPSSSIKGLVRAYAELYNKLPEHVINKFFGDKESVGLAIFTNAYPVKCSPSGGGEASLVDPDVVTPHYSEVGGAIDEASSSPTPLVFPTIAKGVTLAFAIGIRSEDTPLNINLVTQFINVVNEALDQGIGARTSVGYGRIRIVKNESTKLTSSPGRSIMFTR